MFPSAVGVVDVVGVVGFDGAVIVGNAKLFWIESVNLNLKKGQSYLQYFMVSNYILNILINIFN